MQRLVALYDQGYQATAIAKRLGGLLRAQLIDGTLQSEPALQLLARLIEVPSSYDPERFLEITLLSNRATVEPQPTSVTAEPVAPLSTQPISPPATPETPKPQKALKPTSQAATMTLSDAIWPEVLQTLKQRHNTLYGVVRMAQPDFSEAGTVKLAFAFAFHQKRLSENANREKLAAIIQELTGAAVNIEGVHDAKAQAPPSPPANENEAAGEDDLSVISNIFGEAKLLES
jgi:hypothetical protein